MLSKNVAAKIITVRDILRTRIFFW